ncbi:MAG: helix-turn-helix domain-containing protein, partial [Actinomycetota bacterium]
ERWAMADPVVMTNNFSGSIGEEEMTRLEANVHTLRDWESRFRMGVRRKAVIGQLNEVADLVKGSQSSAVTSRLFKVMAELSRIAGFMSYDAGMHGAAQKYYSLALSATDAGGDRLFGVDILLAMSRQMLDLDRPTDGLELVRLAFEGRGVSMPPRAQAILRTREAWAYAKMGRVQAFQRAVGLAEESFATQEAGEEPHWIKRYDAAELSGIIGARYRDLARHDPSHARQAIERIKEALILRDRRSLFSRAFDTVGLGRAYLLVGEPEEACRVTRPVLEMAGVSESGRVCRRLRDFSREAEPYRELPQVAEFREEIGERVLRGRRGVRWLG